MARCRAVPLLLVLAQWIAVDHVTQAAVTQRDDNSLQCSSVRSLFVARGIAENVVTEAASSPGPEESLCRSPRSCCTSQWEQGLQHMVRRDFQQLLEKDIAEIRTSLKDHAVHVQNTILAVISLAKENTESTFSEAYRDSVSILLTPIRELFADFEKYFQSQLTGPELEQSVSEFFDSLFPVSYKDSINPFALDLEENFIRCLREKRKELRPFKEVPYRMTTKILRMFGVAKIYLQSLYVGVDVLNTTTHFQYSDSCYRAMTRLSYCSLCQGLSEVKPCTGFCNNVLRGCLAPLSPLAQTWENYIGVLQRLATTLQQNNNIEDYLFKMDTNMAAALVSVWDHREQLEEPVRQACGSPLGGPPPPAAPAPASAPVSESGGRRKREVPLFSQAGDLDMLLPQSSRQDGGFSMEETALAQTLRNFNSKVEAYKKLYRSLADNACQETAFYGPAECWNGEKVGDYTRPLAGVGLDSQAFNPEVEVPHLPDPVVEEKADTLERVRQIALDKMTLSPSVGDSRGAFDDSALLDGSGSGGGYPTWDDEDNEYYYDYYDYGSGSGFRPYDYYGPDEYDYEITTDGPLLGGIEPDDGKDLEIDPAGGEVPQVEVTGTRTHEEKFVPPPDTAGTTTTPASTSTEKRPAAGAGRAALSALLPPVLLLLLVSCAGAPVRL